MRTLAAIATRAIRGVQHHPSPRGRWWTLCLGLGLLSACSGGSGEGGSWNESAAPALVLLDSVEVQETDSLYVAEPGAISVGADGTFYIADRFGKTIHAVRRDGRFRQQFGRSGKGPGEFDMPGYLALGGDSVLYAADIAEVEMFDLRSGAHRGAYRIPRAPGGIAMSGGRLFAALPDRVQRGSYARLSATGGISVTGPFPELLGDSVLFPMFWPVAIAMNGDTAATAFTVSNSLYLSDAAGRTLDSIPVPARKRHGVDRELLLRFSAHPTDEKLGESALYGTSLPTYLHWLQNGRVALVSTDWKVVEGRFVETSYLSVVDTKRRASCVDARVPGPTDPPVRVAFRGDTLFVLTQEVPEEGLRGSVVIRSYRIDTGPCRWL